MRKMKIAISAAVAVLSMSLFIGFTGNTAQVNAATSGSSFTVTTYEYVNEGCSSSTGNRSGYGINYGISSDSSYSYSRRIKYIVTKTYRNGRLISTSKYKIN